MSMPQTPKLLRLDPPGPYVTQVVEAFRPALGYPPGEGLPIRLCFILSNGVELHLPVSVEIADEIRDTLTSLFPPKTYGPE